MSEVDSTMAKADGFVVEQGQTLVCFGDSITQNSVGYCSMLAAVIAGTYPARGITVVNAGIGGNKIHDLLARVDRDVLVHRPDWVTVSIGINDVWHGLAPGSTAGVPVETYREGLATLVDILLASGAKVVLLPPTVIEENPSSTGNLRLVDFRAAMHAVAASRGVLVAPTDLDLDAALASGVGSGCGEAGKTLTSDGVHLRPPGDAVVAVAVLKTLGFFGVSA